MNPALTITAAVWAWSVDALILKLDDGDVKPHKNKSRRTVWIHAFARSGSSTILSMVSENDSKNAKRGPFTLFEPCHPDDKLDPQLARKGCVGMLQSLTRCDFSGIRKLHNWFDVHSKRRGVNDYVPELAGSACSGAELVAFKTITKAYEKFVMQEHALDLLENEPGLHVIDVIRDPRSIYSSWMSTWPFNDAKLGGLNRNVTALLDICNTFATNLRFDHPRVHRLKFEDLVKNPVRVTQSTYEGLGMTFGDAQKKWVRKTFNAKNCPGVDQWIAPYSDCHTESDEPLNKWRKVMTTEEKASFAAHPQCQLVAETYGYPLSE